MDSLQDLIDLPRAEETAMGGVTPHDQPYPSGAASSDGHLRKGRKYKQTEYPSIPYTKPHVFRENEASFDNQIRSSETASTTSSHTTLLDRGNPPRKWPEQKHAATSITPDENIELVEPITDRLPKLNEYKIMLETITCLPSYF